MEFYYYPIVDYYIDNNNLFTPKIDLSSSKKKQYRLYDRNNDKHEEYIDFLNKHKISVLPVKVKNISKQNANAPIGPPPIPSKILFTKNNLKETSIIPESIANQLIKIDTANRTIDFTGIFKFRTFLENNFSLKTKKYIKVKILNDKLISKAVLILLKKYYSNISKDTKLLKPVSKTVYDYKGLIHTDPKYPKFIDLIKSLKKKFQTKDKFAVVFKYKDGTECDPINIDKFNYLDMVEKIGKTYNKGHNPYQGSGDFEEAVDKNNNYFVAFKFVDYIDKGKKNKRRCGGWIDMMMRQEFKKTHSSATVRYLKNTIGIPYYKDMSESFHRSCIVFGILNSNIGKYLTEHTKVNIARYATTAFRNFETRKLKDIVLPILEKNEPPIKGIKLIYCDDYKDKHNSGYRNMSYGETTDDDLVLNLGCVNNHYFPELVPPKKVVDDIIKDYTFIQGQHKSDLYKSTFSLIIFLCKYMDKFEGLSEFTEQELLSLDIDASNQYVQNILKTKYSIDITSGLPFNGIEKELGIMKKYFKQEPSDKTAFDGIVVFDIEGAPDPTDNNRSKFYLGVCKSIPFKEIITSNKINYFEVVETDVKAFSRAIIREIRKSECRNVVAVAFNTTYDLNALISTAIYSKSYISRAGKMIRSVFEFEGGVTITVIDLWRMISSSLKDAATNLKLALPKESFPHHLIEYTPEWLDDKLIQGNYTEIETKSLDKEFIDYCTKINTIEKVSDKICKVDFGTTAVEYCRRDVDVTIDVFTEYQRQLNLIFKELVYHDDDEPFIVINGRIQAKDEYDEDLYQVNISLLKSYSLPSIGYNMVKQMGGFDSWIYESSLYDEIFGRKFCAAGRTIVPCVEDKYIKSGKRTVRKAVVYKEMADLDGVSLYPSAIKLCIGGFPTVYPQTFLYNLTFKEFFELKRTYPHFLAGISPKKDMLDLTPVDLPVLFSLKETTANSTRTWVNRLFKDEIYYPTNFCLMSLSVFEGVISIAEAVEAVFQGYAVNKPFEYKYIEKKIASFLDKHFDIKFVMYYPQSGWCNKFTRYIEKMFEIKSDNTHPLQFVAKNLNNAPIGKLGVKIDLVQETIEKEEKVNTFSHDYISHHKIPNSTNGLCLVQKRNYIANIKQKNFLTQLNFIWAGARFIINMYEACLREVGDKTDENYIFCSDTDSLIIQQKYVLILEKKAVEVGLVKKGFDSNTFGSLSNDLNKKDPTSQITFVKQFVPCMRKVYYINSNSDDKYKINPYIDEKDDINFQSMKKKINICKMKSVNKEAMNARLEELDLISTKVKELENETALLADQIEKKEEVNMIIKEKRIQIEKLKVDSYIELYRKIIEDEDGVSFDLCGNENNKINKMKRDKDNSYRNLKELKKTIKIYLIEDESGDTLFSLFSDSSDTDK